MTQRINKPNTAADVKLHMCLDRKQSFLMVAGAGSGKTTSLVKALAHIGGKFGPELRRRGQRVACITYTTVAEHEISADVGHDQLFHVSTIHGFLWDLIKPFQEDIRSWIETRIKEKIAEKEEHNAKPRTKAATIDKNNQAIVRYQETLTKIHHIQKFKYETGSDYLNGIIGHSDVIKMGPALIEKHPLLRKITAQKYPFFFVDESQDTDPNFVNALRAIDADVEEGFCLGFFGDPMQQIYSTGIGPIPKGDNWELIQKPENFRCSKTVLSVINNIRSSTREEPLLIQEVGNAENAIYGSAKLFVLEANDQRDANLAKVRQWMAANGDDPIWIDLEHINAPKKLVIVHKMAAVRLGFEALHEAFNLSGAPENIKLGYAEGTHWTLKPFLDFIIPLVMHWEHNNFEAMKLLRALCPRLEQEYLKTVPNTAEHLQSLKHDIDSFIRAFNAPDGMTIQQALTIIADKNLYRLDKRFEFYLGNQEIVEIVAALDDVNIDDFLGKQEEVVRSYLLCPVQQLIHYQQYIGEQTVFSTQHGVKGAEFERVITVLDDEEGRYNLYSYEKLFGLKELSKTDKQNLEEGKDNVLGRTTRLFYVCCSRALKELAVVMFIANPEEALNTIKAKGFFPEEDILTIEDLNNI